MKTSLPFILTVLLILSLAVAVLADGAAPPTAPPGFGNTEAGIVKTLNSFDEIGGRLGVSLFTPRDSFPLLGGHTIYGDALFTTSHTYGGLSAALSKWPADNGLRLGAKALGPHGFIVYLVKASAFNW